MHRPLCYMFGFSCMFGGLTLLSYFCIVYFNILAGIQINAVVQSNEFGDVGHIPVELFEDSHFTGQDSLTADTTTEVQGTV